MHRQAKEALDFIGGILQSPLPASTPFFAMIAPPACHSPWVAAPQFASRFAGRKAPRWPNFNRHPGRKDKHWLVRQAPPGPLPRNIIQRVDHVFRQRWRTLLSVDYMVILKSFFHFTTCYMNYRWMHRIGAIFSSFLFVSTQAN